MLTIMSIGLGWSGNLTMNESRMSCRRLNHGSGALSAVKLSATIGMQSCSRLTNRPSTVPCVDVFRHPQGLVGRQQLNYRLWVLGPAALR